MDEKEIMNRKKVITKEELIKVMSESTPPHRTDSNQGELYLIEICETD